MTEQVKFRIDFPTDDFAANPTTRCPCVLVLDISGSMGGRPIDELNAGLQALKNDISSDAMASKSVELAIVTFGPTKVEHPFTDASTFDPPTLKAQGDTPMGGAIMQALDLVKDRKAVLRANGIQLYRPWVFLITDGAPTDAWQTAATAIREGEASKAFAFFAIGVKGANMDLLTKISVREPLQLDDLKFKELFIWLSGSLRNVSRSTPGTEVQLVSPKGWASV